MKTVQMWSVQERHRFEKNTRFTAKNYAYDTLEFHRFSGIHVMTSVVLLRATSISDTALLLLSTHPSTEAWSCIYN